MSLELESLMYIAGVSYVSHPLLPLSVCALAASCNQKQRENPNPGTPTCDVAIPSGAPALANAHCPESFEPDRQQPFALEDETKCCNAEAPLSPCHVLLLTHFPQNRPPFLSQSCQ